MSIAVAELFSSKTFKQLVTGKYRNTFQARIDIGFPNNRMVWKYSPAIYSQHTLKICGHPVMEDWEEPYMKRLADTATMNNGIVLEVGFGMGISANFIQRHNIEKHIIIEANQEVAERARRFAEQAPHKIEILEGFWQEVVDDLPNDSLDGILFDTYPLSSEEIHCNAIPFFGTAFVKLKGGGVFTYYSDEQNDYSFDHISSLLAAGFKRENIARSIVHVEPPVNCQYWKSKTILAPIITKIKRRIEAYANVPTI